MKKKHLIIIVAIVAMMFTGCQSSKNVQSDHRRPAKERIMEKVTIEAEVTAVNLQERTVTLKDETGNLSTLQVGDNVKRLDEIRAGDVVKAEYLTYMLTEFRDPTPEEYQEPLVVIADAEVASKDLPPGAAVGAVIKAVVTVEAKDMAAKLVTIKGPRGNYVVLPVEDVALLEDLKIGERVVIIYTEVVALTLEKIK
jgi:Cu/Ag efflux protein CusF